MVSTLQHHAQRIVVIALELGVGHWKSTLPIARRNGLRRGAIHSAMPTDERFTLQFTLEPSPIPFASGGWNDGLISTQQNTK
jgi:hypothetical protein